MSGLVQRAINALRKRALAPSIPVEKSSSLYTLGSSYGSWTFLDSPDLYGSTIISCGLGEDASFDVEFAARFSARVILVDPTPRAIQHFHQITGRLGQPSTQPYAAGGKQPAGAYDLSQLSDLSLVLEPFALWTAKTTLKFFAPSNSESVSHSIVNFQNGYRQDTPSIEVETVTLPELFAKHNLHSLPLLKLDIEGAELDVLADLLGGALLPRQLLVEFDEMSSPTRLSKARTEATDKALRAAGYRCLHHDGSSNFLYVRT